MNQEFDRYTIPPEKYPSSLMVKYKVFKINGQFPEVKYKL